MGKYSIKDFKIGDAVYHITNEYLIMAITDININKNKISCRWFDSDGKVQTAVFAAQELGKAEELLK